MKRLLGLLLAIVLLAFFIGLAIFMQSSQDDAVLQQETLLSLLEDYTRNLPESYGMIEVDTVFEQMANGEDAFVLVDVREESEILTSGVIEGAIHIPLRELGENLALLPNPAARIVLVCQSGFRSTIGMTALHILGYEHTQTMVGGIQSWEEAQYPLVAEPIEAQARNTIQDLDPSLIAFMADYLASLPKGWGRVQPIDLYKESFDANLEHLFDVRSTQEGRARSYILDAQALWLDELMLNPEQWPTDLNADMVVYSADGYRAGIAMTILRMLGYSNVRSLAGGLNGWIAIDLPIEGEPMPD